jgi:hypothetical protein
MANKVKLKLGDIIEIIAPADTDIHTKTYYIGYIDTNKIRLEEADGTEVVLTLTNGSLDNESIESIIIKSRAEEEGYARQNNLLLGVWIDLFFSGDLPLTLTGKITNLDGDKIEITTFPEKDVIFLDFAYRGLPEDLPIEKIQIRRAPEMTIEEKEQEQEQEQENTRGLELNPDAAPEDLELSEMEKRQRELQQQLEEMPGEAEGEGEIMPEAPSRVKIAEEMRTRIFNADQIKFGDEELEAITQLVDVPEEEQRYDIEKQLDDLLDDMLSTVPNAQRTDEVKNNIHKMIQRFQQLRDSFSIFDNKGYALMPKAQGANYKPLVAVMEKLDKQLYWLLPVVQTMKKLYLDDDETAEGAYIGSDTLQLDFAEELRAEKTIQERYEQNDTGNETNKYTFLQKELNAFFTPFAPLDSESKKDVMAMSKVNTTITTVVDNLENLTSSVQGHDTYSHPNSAKKADQRRHLSQKRFALQSFTTGVTGLEMTKMRGENPVIKRNLLTPNESIAIKSLLTLPEATVRFARVNLMSTNLLEKSNLNMHFLNYWQLLREKTHVAKTTITDLNKPYQHDAERFLKEIKHYTVAPELLAEEPSDVAYNKFLETVIPKTKFLFNLIKPNLVGKLSITDILTYLEPFMVYQADLTYMQYKEMNEYIQEKILEYRKKYATKAREYGNMKGTQLVALPSLIKILDENPNMRTKVLDVYGFTDTITQMTNADFMKHILEMDNGVFYNNAIALISANLMIGDGTRDMTDISTYLNTQTSGNLAAAAAAATKGKTKGRLTKAQTQAAAALEATAVNFGEQATCNKIKVIAKRYIEIDELQEDNGKAEVYFDKKYDTTAYDIGEKFKADKNMSLNDQLQHYSEKLMKSKGMDEMNARRDAEAIIQGKRQVFDGEYAILETTDESSATLQYYIRTKDTWVFDDTIDPATFAEDAKMLCNLNEKCIMVKDTCQDQTTGANELKKQNLKLLLAEFDTSLNVNKDIIGNQIESELSSADSRMDALRQIRLLHQYKYETKKMTLANSLEASVEAVTSPYAGLWNMIMEQADVTKRYLDITKFVAAFTREGFVDSNESPFWLYCNKTDQKLLPTFIYKLALTFINGGDFMQVLNQICTEQGKLSDDGDKWVDEHSGQTIKMIELNADEEYNEEGFKIISRSVMEMDAGEVVMQTAAGVGMGKGANAVGANAVGANAVGANAVGANARKYATPDATKIYNVIDRMSKNMDIVLVEQDDFIVRNVLKQISNASVMPSKAAYEKILAMSAAKGKTIDTYEMAYNSTLLYLTFAYYLIAIQISIPPIKTKTTFPGCKKSFSGFPVDGTDNMKGLTYVACVAQKMKNAATLPWSAIANRSATFIAKQIEINISKFILPTEEVQNGIKELKLYLSGNPELGLPAEHNVTNWSSFLPPLKTLKMGTTQDVGEVFKSRLSDSLRKGSAAQQDYISEVQAKMIAFSFNIIELIEKTVHGEQAILRSNGGEPFLENACCEVSENNTLQYFIKKQPEIAILNNKVVRLSDLYADAKRISKAALLYDPRNTKRLLREVSQNFSEDTIYRAFIVYCKFNSLVPLQENLKAVCPTKPEDFDLNDSLEESIRKLKSNARNYNENSLQQLLDVINNSTKQQIAQVPKKLTNAERLNAIMLKLDEQNTRPSLFRAAFMEVLENFEINALLDDTVQMRKFKNILAKLNEDMENQVLEFVGTSGVNMRGAVYKNFKQCLTTIMQFKETGDNLFLVAKQETGYKMINFMKKTMRCLTKEFPNIIVNKLNYTKEASVPKHWKLSEKHDSDVKEIIKSHYAELNKFYDDVQINLLMEKLQASGEDMNELAQNTLFYAPVEMKTRGVSKAKSISSARGADANETMAGGAGTGGAGTGGAGTGGAGTGGASSSKASSEEKRNTFKYSAFDLDLTTALFKFYFLSVLTDLVSFQDDKDILQVPLIKLQESSSTDEEESGLFMEKAVELEILIGNKAELIEKIGTMIVSFTNLICKDKSAIDYNYKSLMDLILRSKEKEKDEITDYLKNMTVEEREVENLFKGNKLGRWSKGEQKGIHTYDTQTYDEEREQMEKTAAREARLNTRSVVTDMNRDIFNLEMLATEESDESIDREDNIITYMGEDAEPEDYDMDGDENYNY